jgi:hypothetical protein
MVGIGFNLERPDARQKLVELGLDYDAVCNGEQALSESQIDALFASEVSAALAYARTRLSGFHGMEPAERLMVLSLIYDWGPAQFVELLQKATAANGGASATTGQSAPDHWFG